MSIFEYQNFYLVGIKGVAMTSITQCLIDAEKNVFGSDVKEDFVTAKILNKENIKIDDINSNLEETFKNKKIDCLIYTAAHQGIDNHQVQTAQKLGIKIYSQAEALAEFFNHKKGIAVCGVGGKSSTSAMITWILEKIAKPKPSFSVGVGEIIGLEKTGQWVEESEFFVAEADEYVVDPNALNKNEEIIPRFSYLNPYLTICTNLKFDHPDVYKDFEDSKKHFQKFFSQIKDNGILLINGDSLELIELSKKFVQEKKPNIKIISFGKNPSNNYQISNFSIEDQLNSCLLKVGNQEIKLQIKTPGRFNLMNAVAAVAAIHQLGFSLEEIVECLKSFNSTKRRFEQVKEGHFDDYAHHPLEVEEAIKTIREYFPDKKKLIAFQPHTYSRTKNLFDQFVDALGKESKENEEIILLDIFSSAREEKDPSINSDLLVAKVKEKYPNTQIKNLETIENLAQYIKDNNFEIFITLGAGDIYEVHQKI